MGKATKWFRSLLGLKKPDAPSPSQPAPPHSDHKPPKRRWSFVKSYREKDRHATNYFGLNEPRPNGAVDAKQHAVAVAAAAVESAQVVLRMTSSGRSMASAKANDVAHISRGGFRNGEEWAAVKIQSRFRAYLARRALKALKALVKVQALVRGNLVRRKQTVDMQRGIQALLRAQARARAERRSQFFYSPHSTSKSSSSLFLHPGAATPEKFDHAAMRAKGTKQHDHSLNLKRNGSKSNCRIIVDQDKTLVGSWEQHGYTMRSSSTDDEKSDKILEIDPGRPQFIPKHRNFFQSPHHMSLTTSAFHQTFLSPSFEAQTFNPLALNQHFDAENGPVRGPFTPTKSEGSRIGLNGYSDHPNYLTCTESSKAKMRSLSAPRQRVGLQFERASSTANRYSVVYGELRGSCNRQRVYGLNDGFFVSKGYPGSGHLDRLGMPVGGGDSAGFAGGNWNRR
ncbi:hypothetical protein LguiB_034663 [Lonicera macranthoides]